MIKTVPKLSKETAASSCSWVVRLSKIHGRGLFAARSLAAGEWVVEYRGERIGKAESGRRQRARRRTWIFEWNRHFDLDGLLPGNPARFLNHSCAPNCETVPRNGKLWVRTTQAVGRDVELTFDYGYRLAAFPGHRCVCGAAACGGFMVAKSERWRMRRFLGERGRSLLPARRRQKTEALR